MKKTDLMLILFTLFTTVAIADDTPEYNEMIEAMDKVNKKQEVLLEEMQTQMNGTATTEEETSNTEVSAVSKVMERFSVVTPHTEVMEEQVAEVVFESDAPLETLTPIQTAKFETKEMPYVYPKGSDTYSTESLIKKPILEKNTTQKVTVSKKKSGKTLLEIEKEARKIIALEMKKVKEAEENALKKIAKAVKNVEEARGKEENLTKKK
jgi:hypothetical protein